MPLVTTLIDDTSPLISYDNTWMPGSSSGDTLASDYYLGTFSTNNVANGAATFSFNGTAVWIYGAKRPNHGTFTVKVDQQSFAGLNGAANNIFQTPLFNLSGLSQAMHTVSLTNTGTGGQYVDIDMIVWQSEVGNEGDQLVTEIVEDTDPRFQYQEPAWSSSSSSLNFNLFSNGTGHATQTYQASVTFTFTVCEAVTLFGTSGPSNGQYTVQLDGGQTMTYNASHGPTTNYGVAIYHADNLGPGSHQVVLSNLPGTSGQSLSIDYAQLWTAANASSSGSAPGTFTSDGSTSQGMGSGAIAGIVVAVVAAVIATGAALFFYRRWKAALDSLNNPYSPVQRSADRSTFTPSETRSIGTVLQSEASAVRPYGVDNNQATQFGGSSVQLLPGSRPSQSVVEASSFQLRSSADEQGQAQAQAQGRRRLPETPGGHSVSTDFSKMSGLARATTIGGRSIAVIEAPPNYMEATVDR